MKTRIHFLDNLRTFMILLVIVLHAAIGYTSFLENVWIINDPSKNSIIGYSVFYIDIFVMFIMFFISGYFVPQSYNKRSLSQFIAAKFKHIMIPWMVAVFTLIPAFKYIFLYSRGLPQEEWYTYFHFFTRPDGNMGYFADNPSQSWLWFLPVLFLFQVVYALLARSGILKIRISMRNAIIFTFFTGLVYSLTIATLDLNGWFTSPLLHFQRERLLAYFLFFLLGSLCYKLKVFESEKKHYVLSVTSISVLALSVYIFTILTNNYMANIVSPGRNIYIVSEATDGIMYYSSVYLAVLSSLQVFISIFRFALNKTNRILGEMSKNSYQVYIIHIVIIGLLGFPLINTSAPALLKYVILFTSVFIVCNLLVSLYRRTIQEIFSKKIFAYASITTFAIITLIACGQIQESRTEVSEKTASAIPAPELSIHMAAIYGDTLVIQQHIIAGTNVNKKEPAAASTPLISASLFGKTDAVRILIAEGADINYQNNEGSTALHTAAFFCRTDIVKLLLKHGADTEIRNNSGSTALESVLAPWEVVKSFYDYFGNTLGPLGLELDYKYLEETRPKVAEILMK